MRRLINWLLPGLFALVVLVPAGPGAAQGPMPSETPSVRADGVLAMLYVDVALYDAAWSPDGQLLAVGSSAGLYCYTADFQAVPALTLPGEAVYAVDWRPDGQQLASGRRDGTVRIWELASTGDAWTLHTTVAQDWDDVAYVAWSPDGATLAVLGRVYRAGVLEPLGYGSLWDTATWRMTAALPGPLLPAANRLTWSPDSRYIAGGGQISELTAHCALCDWQASPMVYLFDTVLAQTTQIIPGLPPDAGDLAWQASGELAIAYYGFRVYDTCMGRAVPTAAAWQAEHKYYSRIAWAPSGPLIAGANGNTLDVVDSRAGIIQVDGLPTAAAPIQTLVWHPTGGSLVVIGHNGIIEAYDVQSLIRAAMP